MLIAIPRGGGGGGIGIGIDGYDGGSGWEWHSRYVLYCRYSWNGSMGV